MICLQRNHEINQDYKIGFLLYMLLTVQNTFLKTIDVKMITVQHFSDDAFNSGRSTAGKTAPVIFEL